MSDRLVVVGTRDPGSWDAGFAHISYTDDLSTWTQVDLEPQVEQDSGLSDVIFVEGLGWVAVGFENIGDWVYEALILQSDDAETWNRISPPGEGNQASRIAYHDGLWVMTGSSSSIWTSTNLEDWTARSSNVNAGGQGLRGLVYADGLWIATGGNGVITTSPDGITWTARTSGTSNVLWTLDHNGAFWWAFSRLNDTRQSVDGESWIQGSNVESHTSAIRDCSWAQSRWHVVSDLARVYRSTDAFGSSWTFSEVQGVHFQQDQNRFLHFGNNVWVWGGTGWSTLDGSTLISHYVATSLDAVNWTLQSDAWSDNDGNYSKTTDAAAWGFVATGVPSLRLLQRDDDNEFGSSRIERVQVSSAQKSGRIPGPNAYW